MKKRKTTPKIPDEIFVVGYQLANGSWDLDAYGSLAEVPESVANSEIFLYELTGTRMFRVQKILES